MHSERYRLHLHLFQNPHYLRRRSLKCPIRYQSEQQSVLFRADQDYNLHPLKELWLVSP